MMLYFAVFTLGYITGTIICLLVTKRDREKE